MNREIKFRVWDAVAKRYVDLSTLTITYDGKLTAVTTSEIMNPVLNQKNYIVEQYTGLKDKNGKEICEGDIFRNTINGGTWRVYWNEKDSAFWVDSGVDGCNLGDFDWDRNNRKYGFVEKNCEVIGNVHEPPKDFRPEHLKRMGVSISKGGEE